MPTRAAGSMPTVGLVKSGVFALCSPRSFCEWEPVVLLRVQLTTVALRKTKASTLLRFCYCRHLLHLHSTVMRLRMAILSELVCPSPLQRHKGRADIRSIG